MAIYKHLQPEERAFILLGLSEEISLTKIAEKLGRSLSTISRELRRQNSSQYSATKAASRYQQLRKRCHKGKKLISGTPLFDRVHNMLRYRQWSPEQISSRLKLEHPDDPTMHVSHECIYASIYAFPRNALKKVLIAELRQHKSKRGVKRKSNCSPVKVLPEQQIDQRPKEIEDRQMKIEEDRQWTRMSLRNIISNNPRSTSKS